MHTTVTRPIAAGTRASASGNAAPSCHIFQSPLEKVASPNDRCNVLITNVVGTAEPKWYQLKTHQGSTTAAAVSGATQKRRRMAGTAR